MRVSKVWGHVVFSAVAVSDDDLPAQDIIDASFPQWAIFMSYPTWSMTCWGKDAGSTYSTVGMYEPDLVLADESFVHGHKEPPSISKLRDEAHPYEDGDPCPPEKVVC
jgi:hypothetical protein